MRADQGIKVNSELKKRSGMCDCNLSLEPLKPSIEELQKRTINPSHILFADLKILIPFVNASTGNVSDSFAYL